MRTLGESYRELIRDEMIPVKELTKQTDPVKRVGGAVTIPGQSAFGAFARSIHALSPRLSVFSGRCVSLKNISSRVAR